MQGELIGVADARGSLFATLGADGTVSVWSGLDELLSRFTVEFARSAVPVPSDRLAIVDDGTGPALAVGSWTQGVAAFNVGGQVLWHRRDIRHVQRLRAVPDAVSGGRSLAVVQERVGGLILGRTGGTRHRLPGAEFLDGWPDASLLVFDGKRVSRREPPYSESSWTVSLPAIGVLDAVVGDEALICHASEFVTLVGEDGEVRWRASAGKGRRVVRVRPDPLGGGWVCLAPTTRSRHAPQVLKIARGGVIMASVDLPADDWIDFVLGGRYVVAASGKVSEVRFTEEPSR